MLLLVTCNMTMYMICNFVCICMFFSKNKITKKTEFLYLLIPVLDISMFTGLSSGYWVENLKNKATPGPRVFSE